MGAWGTWLVNNAASILGFVTAALVLWKTAHIDSKTAKIDKQATRIEVLVNSRMTTALDKINDLEVRLATLTSDALLARERGTVPPLPPPLPPPMPT